MRSFLRGCSAVLCVVLGGCLSAHDCYEVEIRPDGEAFHRQLTCWHADGGSDRAIQPLRPAELARIGKLYPEPGTPAGGGKSIFRGRFPGNTPADVGGAGSYTHFTSSLGSTSCYAERFRGADDLASQLSKRSTVADRLADLLIDWLDTELGQDPNFPRLKQFLDVDVRQDLKNLAVYAWAFAVTEDPPAQVKYEWFVRGAQYFGERGYFSPQQVPSLVRALGGTDPKPILTHIQHLLQRKMGIADDRPVPASLAFLEDLARLKASFDKYAGSSELLKERLKASQSLQPDAPDPPKTAPEQLADVLSADLAELVGWRIDFGPDTLDVKLICESEPYGTNGKWDGNSAVTWNKRLGSEPALPAGCFALWSTPDRPFQEEHFGKVLLTGEPLAAYVIWYRSLSPEEAGEWDQFLGRLRPNADLKTSIAGFRFPTDLHPDPKQPQDQPASLADTPRGLLLTALGGNDAAK